MHAHFRKRPSLEFGLLLLLGILWGIPFALTKISLETIPPITLTAARVSLAAVASWVIALLLGRKFPWRWDFTGRLFVQGGIACVVPYTLIAFGQQSVSSGLAAILNSTTPIFVCLISMVWTHHEPVTFGRLSGAMIGLGGVVLIVGATALWGLGHPTIGQLAIVLATFSSALSVMHGRRFIETAPEVVAAGTLTCAAILLVPLCFLLESPWRVAPSIASSAALVGNAIGTTTIGFVIYFRLIRTIGSVGTASVSYLKPGVGVLIGCIWLGESWTWTLMFGLAAILIGVATINENMTVFNSSGTRWKWHIAAKSKRRASVGSSG
jgi:drug/metabolite transporter (DMT)-like permease